MGEFSMADVSQIVVDEMASRRPNRADLPEDLRRVADQHFQDMIQLAESLLAVGQDLDTVRSMVSTLVSSYHADLLAAIEARS